MLHIFPVELLAWDCGKIEIIDAADIDAYLGERDAFSVRLRATSFAEEVTDCLLIEKIFAQIFRAGEQCKFIVVDKIEEHPFLATVRTITFHYFGNVSLEFVFHSAAMA